MTEAKETLKELRTIAKQAEAGQAERIIAALSKSVESQVHPTKGKRKRS